MKRLTTLFAMFFALAFAFAIPEAEAKRFASGKSFGKSYRTQPYMPPSQPLQAAPARQQAPVAANSRGMMGGLLGGLLAGGLFAALLGGAFQGIQIMDILIIGVVAFLVMRFLRARQQALRPAYVGPVSSAPVERRVYDLGPSSHSPASHSHGGDVSQCPFMSAGRETAPAAESDSTGESVPFNFVPGFDADAFLTGARDHYRLLQEAWNQNDLSKIREYVSPSILAELEAERASLSGEQHTEVVFVDAEIMRADVRGTTAELSVRFRGACRDRVEQSEEDFMDTWHLERDLAAPNAPWMIVGIESR